MEKHPLLKQIQDKIEDIQSEDLSSKVVHYREQYNAVNNPTAAQTAVMNSIDTAYAQLTLVQQYNISGENSFVTINSGESVSAPMFLGNKTIYRIYMPAVWNQANITVQVSSETGPSGWQNLYDENGAEILLGTPSGKAVNIPPSLFLTDNWIRFRSGPFSSPIPQSGDRTLKVYYRAF